MAINLNNKIKSIFLDFVEKIAQKPFLDSKYVVYLYTIDRKGNTFDMRLEAYREAKKFNKTRNYPLPKEIGKSWEIPSAKYQFFAYGRGGDIISLDTVYGYHAFQEQEIPNPDYWKNKFAYFCRYQCNGQRLVIILIFDVDSNDSVEHEVMSIDLFPILKGVEDIHHKKIIFCGTHLNLLKKKIDKKIFPIANKSIEKLFQGFRYSQYLLKIYYDFLYTNMEMLGELGISSEQQEKFFLLTEEFEESQKNLFRVPRYRDHFLHQ